MRHGARKAGAREGRKITPRGIRLCRRDRAERSHAPPPGKHQRGQKLGRLIGGQYCGEGVTSDSVAGEMGSDALAGAPGTRQPPGPRGGEGGVVDGAGRDQPLHHLLRCSLRHGHDGGDHLALAIRLARPACDAAEQHLLEPRARARITGEMGERSLVQSSLVGR